MVVFDSTLKAPKRIFVCHHRNTISWLAIYQWQKWHGKLIPWIDDCMEADCESFGQIEPWSFQFMVFTNHILKYFNAALKQHFLQFNATNMFLDHFSTQIINGKRAVREDSQMSLVHRSWSGHILNDQFAFVRSGKIYFCTNRIIL